MLYCGCSAHTLLMLHVCAFACVCSSQPPRDYSLDRPVKDEPLADVKHYKKEPQYGVRAKVCV